MKTDVILFAICLAVGAMLPLLLFGTDTYIKGHGEIQLHDLYFVVSSAEFGLATTGLLMFPVFLIRSLKASLRTRLSLVFLGLGGTTIILIAIVGFRLLESLHKGSYPS
jgi:hypothetical protein